MQQNNIITYFLLLCYTLISSSASATLQNNLVNDNHGFLDVTKAPFDIDNTGKTDVTKELQKAITYARLNYFVVYLPLGTYLISDTLVLLELEAWNPRLPPDARAWNNTHPCRFQPNVLVGEKASSSVAKRRIYYGKENKKEFEDVPVRPIIYLADNSPGFDNTTIKKPVVDITRSSDPTHPALIDGTNFNQLFRGIDIHIGNGNPSASGVQLPGAQGCSVQDSTIVVGSGYSGITGGSGAGGGHAMVTIIGGKVGLDYSVSLNCPGTAGARLLGQTEAAIVYSGLEAASFTGAYIKPAKKSTLVLQSVEEGIEFGQVSMIDSIIEYPDPVANDTAICVAINTIHSLYLNNVYMKNCDKFVNVGLPLLNKDVKTKNNNKKKVLSSSQWIYAKEFATGVPISTPGRSCINLAMPVYVNNKKTLNDQYVDVITSGVTPPSPSSSNNNILNQHRWDEATFPTWDEASNINAKDFGAVGDGKEDDTKAIQSAIDMATKKNTYVFLPKGFYRISKTLNLTCLGIIGTARSLTVLMPMSDGLIDSNNRYSEKKNNDNVVVDEASPILYVGGTNVKIISMLSIVTWEHLDNVFALHWENTNTNSIYRQNYFYRICECFFGFPNPTPVPHENATIPCKENATLIHPLNLLNNGASGKFYNFENEDFLYEAPSYRHLLVQHGESLKFYNLNMEHSQSEANAEFDMCNDIRIYSLKSEGEWRETIFDEEQNNRDIALWVRNSTNVHVYSYGGNAIPLWTGKTYPSNFKQYPPSLYRIENTCPFTATNLVDQIAFPKDDMWNFLYEWHAGEDQTFLSPHCERPVLYKLDYCK